MPLKACLWFSANNNLVLDRFNASTISLNKTLTKNLDNIVFLLLSFRPWHLFRSLTVNHYDPLKQSIGFLEILELYKWTKIS